MHGHSHDIPDRQAGGNDRGIALVTVILVTMLCAALMVGFVSAIGRVSGR